MKIALSCATSLVLLLSSSLAFGGGSSVSVNIISLDIGTSSTFVLTVAPQVYADSPRKDQLMGECSVFTVKGAYQPPRQGYGSEFTYRAHEQALSYLLLAHRLASSVRLGWIGDGFAFEGPRSDCTARSKALALLTGSDGNAHVVSRYGAS